MQIRLLLGPAGSGKTYRCLEEVRQALNAAPEGAPLIFLAPKQATYQLERQLLVPLAGYTRLRILSFERLAEFLFEAAGAPVPERLDEEGRVMVLRGLLARKRRELKLFRASARLTGFARQLSQVLSELQRDQLTPESLRELAGRCGQSSGLALKLDDLATLLQDYLDWLAAHRLQDVDSLLLAAADLLRSTAAAGPGAQRGHGFMPPGKVGSFIEALWLDGFAEFSRRELALLAALMPHCERATLAFCLDRPPAGKPSWLSSWSVTQRSYECCRAELAQVPGAELVNETLPRRPHQNRFALNPVFQHLEQSWPVPEPYRECSAQPGRKATSRFKIGAGSQLRLPGFESPLPAVETQPAHVPAHLRLAACRDPEAEAVLAAREIRAHVRGGGRYRETAVLVRDLEVYQAVLQRVFARYEIPAFVDRRESVAHHPLAELTRSALRTVALGWQSEDFFAALKTGLAPADETEIDRLENEALGRGWQGTRWQKPLAVAGEPELGRWATELQRRIVPPFQHLALALALNSNQPTGAHLSQALRAFWRELEVEERLEQWATAEVPGTEFRPASVHATVWEQMNEWLENLERAFPTEPLPIRDWLPILEAGLSTLSVGVIPPALDQVLLGAIDRSRNPDLKLAIVLGLNEGVFPARPRLPALLTDADRLELEKQNVLLGSGSRHQLGRERFFAYIACTRARERLVLTWAQRDTQGTPLNPSPFVSHVRKLFPTLEVETVANEVNWENCEHVSELIAPVLKAGGAAARALDQLAPVAAVLERFKDFQPLDAAADTLAPEWAARLYGPVLRTSVSRLEQFAACPFKFFVHSGLRAEERQLFELDVREQGSFQHEVLAVFHEQLRTEGKRWRDLTPAEARERVGAIGRSLAAGYRDGLLQASDQTRFLASSMTESLQDFVATLVDWMRGQYRFDPVAVELGYGSDPEAPAWGLELGDGRRLDLHGRIDRVDLCPSGTAEEALCVVLDYKSSRKQLDPVLLAHGLQLQLLAYLNVLRRWPQPAERFGVNRLVPAGVFYVNLRGRPAREDNRRDALADPVQARKLACSHAGRFDIRALRYLDSRPDANQGDQFNYRLTKNGEIRKNSTEAMSSADFQGLLDSVESHLLEMGRRIYAGDAAVAPFRTKSLLACDQCEYQALCRIDPWTHRYRILRLDAPTNLK